ncbi:hypothetical protein KP509_36G048100 [Ceratopteris richardii]|nr:hypothetical protein KP509_36G048100 [Ceratopteris richardii]
MYGKCGSLDEARFLFDTIDEPNVFSWTIIIAVYAHNGCFEEAYKIFQQMQDSDVRPNEFTFSIILGTIVSYQGLVQGRHIHACAVQNGMDTDAVVGTALINMYGKCTCVKDAALVFCKIQQHDIVAWNAIIAILLANKEGNSALDLFYQMLKNGLEPDAVTFASILGACADQQFLGHGEIIHSAVVSLGYMSNLVVANALIDMYGKCGSPSRAGVIFSQLLHPDVISWTAIIVAYLQHPRKAIQLFKDMLQKGLSPNEFTYASVLTACTSLGSLSKGQIAHHCIIEDGLETNIVIATALLRMYGTCFTMSEALWIFDQLHERDVVLWNAIITIHAQHSLGKEALDLLQQMQQDGHEPDEITFSSVLSACSRAGLVEECCALYSEMSLKYKIVPTVEHCGCMVDLFGRASLLQEAVDFIETMHLKPNFVVWEIFLNSCTLYADKCGLEYAKRIRKELTSRNLQEASAARDNVPV